MMKHKSLTLLLLFLFARVALSQLLITEVMLEPPGGELIDQYIELENIGDQPIDLSNYTITTNEYTYRIVPVNSAIFEPGYALIHTGYYQFSTGRYESIIPSNTMRFGISSATFDSSRSHRTGSIEILLRDENGTAVNQCSTLVGTPLGRSQERVLTLVTPRDINWRTALNSPGTPGKRNSVSPPLRDNGITRLSLYPLPGRSGTPFVQLDISHNGEIASSAQLVISIARNTYQMPTQVTTVNVSGGAYQTNSLITIPLPFLDSLNGIVHATAAFAVRDSVSRNDTISTMASQWEPAFPVISELMTDPISGEPQWVEYVWRGAHPISLEGWKLQVGNQLATIPLDQHFSSNSYFVLSERAIPIRFGANYANVIQLPSWLDWGHTSTLLLISSWGEVIDSVSLTSLYRYRDPSHQSLARSDFSRSAYVYENWYYSLESAGGSPTRLNTPRDSIPTIIPVATTNSAQLETRRFAPGGVSGLPERLVYQIETTGGEWKLSIYDMSGKLRLQRSDGFTPGVYQQWWDGRETGGALVDTGIYILELSWNDHRVVRSSIVVVR